MPASKRAMHCAAGCCTKGMLARCGHLHYTHTNPMPPAVHGQCSMPGKLPPHLAQGRGHGAVGQAVGVEQQGGRAAVRDCRDP